MKKFNMEGSVMERRQIIAGNWKMYKTKEEAIKFIHELAPLVVDIKKDVYLAVPFTIIESCVKVSEKTPVVIGAQNMNDADKGAFTGEIAAIMLKSIGSEFVILGHSERRHIFNETDEFINKKVIKALKDDIEPILCVGETEAQREEDKTEEVLETQLKKCLKNVAEEEADKVVIAYEPVWAIGTGKTATPEIAEHAHKMIRKILSDIYSQDVAEKISILYGGSVKPDNIENLMKQDDIDGALVGGAALDYKSFYEIIKNA